MGASKRQEEKMMVKVHNQPWWRVVLDTYISKLSRECCHLCPRFKSCLGLTCHFWKKVIELCYGAMDKQVSQEIRYTIEGGQKDVSSLEGTRKKVQWPNKKRKLNILP